MRNVFIDRPLYGVVKLFPYGDTETSYLCGKDPLLADVIRRAGHLNMPMDDSLFAALARNIIGQQISIPVYERIWADFRKLYGDDPDPEKVVRDGPAPLRALGMSQRRAEYIVGIADVIDEVDEDTLRTMDDDALLKELTRFKGVGPWTAEMAMIFRYGRQDVFSYGDLALIRGIKVLYGVDDVTRGYFDSLKRRFSPCSTVACLYIWEVGEGRVTPPERP